MSHFHYSSLIWQKCLGPIAWPRWHIRPSVVAKQRVEGSREEKSPLPLGLLLQVPALFHTQQIVKRYSNKRHRESRSVMSNSLQHHRLYSPWNSPGKNTGVGSHSLLQGIFPTQGLNPGLPHCRLIFFFTSWGIREAQQRAWWFSNSTGRKRGSGYENTYISCNDFGIFSYNHIAENLHKEQQKQYPPLPHI